MKKSHVSQSLCLLVLLTFLGCASIRRESGPALEGVEVETLTDSEEPAEMARVAASFCAYTAPLAKQLAAFKLAQRAYLADKGDKEAALVLSRSALFLSGLVDDEERKAEIVRKGFEAGLAAGGGEDPGVSYCYGTHLGMLIEIEGMAAAGELPEFEEALLKAAEEPDTDSGGPFRVLGMLYLKAPAWPTGPGDLEKALELLGRAAAAYPEHPQNHLFYAYALAEDDRPEEARRQVDLAARRLSEGEWGDYTPLWREEIEQFRRELDE